MSVFFLLAAFPTALYSLSRKLASLLGLLQIAALMGVVIARTGAPPIFVVWAFIRAFCTTGRFLWGQFTSNSTSMSDLNRTSCHDFYI
jgi:hypothetical protein